MLAIQSPIDSATEVLRRQMLRPQRHRLLHGYPLAAAMKPRRDGAAEDVRFDPRRTGAAGRRAAAPVLQPGRRRLRLLHLSAREIRRIPAREVIAAVRGEIEARCAASPRCSAGR